MEVETGGESISHGTRKGCWQPPEARKIRGKIPPLQSSETADTLILDVSPRKNTFL